MQSKLQLKLLQSLKRRNGLARGFTLVELMIVVAIVGVLAAVALPQYLEARNSAEAGAKIGEAVGLAKECATHAASDLGTAPANAGPGVAWTTACTTTGGVIEATIPAGPVGVKCLDKTTAGTETKATITIDDNGAMTCALT